MPGVDHPGGGRIGGRGWVGRRFLIVEDAPPVKASLEHILEKLGVPHERIDTAGTGDEAMESFKAHHPDVVFLDLQLPGRGGDEVADDMVHMDPGVKVVVLTGLMGSDPRVRAMRSMGAFQVIEKPFRFDTIQTVLAAIASEEGKPGRIR